MSKLIFPPKTILLLSNLGLKENDIHDVFQNGEYRKTPSGTHSVTKKYQSYGYEIGLLYVVDPSSGDYIITYVWKRDRR